MPVPAEEVAVRSACKAPVGVGNLLSVTRTTVPNWCSPYAGIRWNSYDIDRTSPDSRRGSLEVVDKHIAGADRPLSEKGKLVVRRGRKAADQGISPDGQAAERGIDVLTGRRWRSSAQ
jgi:hypothetical protein